MQCPFCQKINRDSAKFCIHCGQAIGEAFGASQKSFDDFDSSDAPQSVDALFPNKAHAAPITGGTIAQFTPQAETAMKNKKNQSHDLERLLNRLDRNEDGSEADDHASHHGEEAFILPEEPQFEADFNIDYSEAPSPKKSILGTKSKKREKKRDDEEIPHTTVADIESNDNLYIGEEEEEEGEEEVVPLPSFLRDKEKRKKIAIIAIVSLFALILILALVFGGDKNEEKSEATTVAQEQSARETTKDEKNQAMTMPEEIPFELTRYEDLPQNNDFADLPGANTGKEAKKNENTREKAVKEAKKNEADVASDAGSAPDGKKLFGPKDNVFAGGEKGKELRLKRACVLREGPSSRFKLIVQLEEKSKVNVLTESDEDWELTQQSGRHVWKKGSERRLGPGTQFFKAGSGQGVPAASGRVISSKRWSYIKSGDNYGWVGPVCFK